MATAAELWEQIKNGNGGKKQTVQTQADTGEASDKAKQIWQQIKGESSGKKQIVSSAPTEEEPSEQAKRIWTLIKRQSAGEAWSSSPRVMAQKARQDYENYISSDEYKQARQSAMQRYNAEHKWDGLLNAMNPMAGGSTLPSAAQIREMEDPKEQELKALAEYYESQADAWDNEQIMKRDMAEFASWPEEDRAALESYIATKNQEFGNIYADPLYSKAELSAADLYRKYGAGKVREMVESYTRYHNQKNAEAIRNFATEQTKDSVGGSILHSAGSVAANALGNYTGPLGLAQELSGRTGRYSTLDPNNLGGIPGQYSGTVREQVVQNIAGENEGFDWRDVAALGYQGTMSAGDNLIRAGLGGGSKAASLGLAAAGSFGQTVQQASAQGATPAQALGLATANSIFEVTTEYIPLDELLKQAKGSPHAVGAIVKNILLQSGIEATTEEINLICSTLAEAAILQDKSAYNQQIARLVAEGASYGEAKAQADRDLVIEAVETAVTSAISGGMSTGTAAAQHRVQATQTGKALYQMAASRDGIQGAIERGFESGAGTEAYKIAEKVAKQYFSGEKVSGRDLNALYRATEVLGQKEIQALIDTGLESAPETDAHRIAESLRKQYYSGKKLSNYDLGALYLANVQTIAEEAKAERKAAAQAEEEAQKQEAAGINRPAAMQNEQNVPQNGENVPQNGENVPVAAQSETAPTQEGELKGLPLPTLEEMNNGGNENVQETRGTEGLTAAQPGAVQTAAGADVLHGGSQRYDGQSAREQAGSMASGAAVRSGRRTADRSRAIFDRQNRAKDLWKQGLIQKSSSLDLGLETGTEAKNILILPQEHWDAEMSQLAERIYNETRKSVTYVMGRIQIRGADGSNRNVRGVISGDNIIVQADNFQLSMEQIADHEAYHAKSGWARENGANLNAEVRRYILDNFSEEEYRAVLEVYVRQMRGVYDVTEAKTGKEYEAMVWNIEEEVFADAYAGINAFDAHAERFTEAVRTRMDEIGMGRQMVQENGVRQTNGPPSDRFSIDTINGEKADYGSGVVLDTDIFDGIRPRAWGKVLGSYVYVNLAGTEMTVYDEEGNPKSIFIARINDRVRKDGANNSHKVIDKLARYRGDNIRALTTVHLSELLATSRHENTTSEHNHQWLDENGWEHRKTYIQDRSGNIYEATLNIANGRDRRILYDINNVRLIDKKRAARGAVPSTNTGRGSLTKDNSSGSNGQMLDMEETSPQLTPEAPFDGNATTDIVATPHQYVKEESDEDFEERYGLRLPTLDETENGMDSQTLKNNQERKAARERYSVDDSIDEEERRRRDFYDEEKILEASGKLNSPESMGQLERLRAGYAKVNPEKNIRGLTSTKVEDNGTLDKEFQEQQRGAKERPKWKPAQPALEYQERRAESDIIGQNVRAYVNAQKKNLKEEEAAWRERLRENERSKIKGIKTPAKESQPTIAKRDLQNTVLNLFSIPGGQRGDLGGMIDSYADRLIKNGSLTEEDRKHFFDRMYESGVMTVPADDYYALGRSYIKEGRIYVPDSVIADFGDDWNDFRRRAFSAGVYLTRDKNHAGIDVWNGDLAAELPGLFDSEETDQRSILERIVQVAEEGRDEKMSLPEYTARLAEREGQSEDEFLDNMERQLDWALRTFAEKAKLEIKLRDRTGVAVAKEKERGNQRRMREFYRDLQRQEKERQARKEAAQRQRDRKALQEMQKKTLKQLQWLSKNRYRAPEELKDAWDEVLGDIDIYAVSAANEMRWSDKHQATWKDLAQMYKDAQKNDPNFLPSKELERIVARLDGEKIGEMDIGALQDLYKAAIGLRTEFYNRNNVINDEMHRLFAEVYSDAKHELEDAPGGYTGKKVDKFLNMDQLTPMNILQRMGGWDPVGTFYSMAKQLEKGERDMRAYTVRANRMLQDFLTEHAEWVKKADGQGKDAIWYEVEVPELLQLGMGDKPIFGDTVKVYMTPAQKVHMYLESKNMDNLRHMTGGRTFVDKDLYSKGKRKEALSQGKTIRLAPETVRSLVSDLTPEEMELAQLLDRYYNTFATQEINRVSNILYGYDKAMGKNYAPIYTNRNYTKTEFGVFDTTAEGVGNLKGRQYAVNPSYNLSAFDAFERHVDQTARFCGMAIPARNWTTLMNWREKNNSTGDVITHKWGEESKRYITDLITTLQGGKASEGDTVSSGVDNLMSNYISAIFGANPSIVLKQLGSIPMAGAYLGNRNAPTIAQVAHIDRDFIAKYSQDLAWRTMGYSMPETKQLKDNPNWTQTNRFFRFTFGGGAITAMDGWAASVLWPWAENKVRREFPELEMGTQEQIENGESPFYRKVAEEFEEALARSQSTTDETHQSSLRKSKNPVTRAFTMFRSDSAQTYNAIRQKIGEAQYYARTGASPEVLRAAKKGAGATVLALLANAAWSEAISFLMALWKNKGKNYRDDEEELTFESVAGTMVQNMAGSVAGTVTFGDELAELIGSVLMGDKWYGIETSGMEQLNDVIDVIYSAGTGMKDLIAEVADVVKNGGDLGAFLSGNSGEILNHIKELSETAAMYFVGLPASNVEAYLLGIVKWVSPELATAYEDVFASTGKSDLSGLDGDALIARAGNVLENRGINVSDDTVQALTDLYAAGYKKAFPSDVPSSVSVDGESRKLGAYQQQTYDKVWSGTVADALDDIVSSDDFSRMDQQGQEKVLSNLYTYAADLAKSEVFDDYEIGSYTERVQDLQREDMSLADAIILSSKMDSSAVKDYLEMTGAGMDADTADTVISEIEDLEPIEGAESVSDVQRWRVVIDSSRDDEQRMVGLFATMTEAQYTKAEIAYDMGVSPDAYVTLQEIKTQYDADGNGSFKNSEIQAAIDGMDMQLTNAQKAVLWQLATGSTSTKGNPYDKNAGQQVIDAREAAKTRSAASEEDEALTAEEALMRQLMGLG